MILFGRRWLQFLLIAQVMILNRVENFGKVVEGKEQGGPGSGQVGILYIFIFAGLQPNRCVFKINPFLSSFKS